MMQTLLKISSHRKFFHCTRFTRANNNIVIVVGSIAVSIWCIYQTVPHVRNIIQMVREDREREHEHQERMRELSEQIDRLQQESERRRQQATF